MNKLNVPLIVGAGALGLGGLAAAATWAKTHTAGHDAAAMVVTDKVRTADAGADVLAEGMVIPGSTVNVSVIPGSQGRVIRLAAEVGDYVTKGQILAEIDTANQQDDFASAAAAAQSARAKLHLTEHPYRPEELEVKRLELEHDQMAVEQAQSRLDLLRQGARSQERDQAQANLATAQAKLDLLTANNARDKQLFAKDLIPKTDMEASDTALIVAQDHLTSAKAHMSLIDEGPQKEVIHESELSLEQARLEYKKDKKNLDIMLMGPRNEEVEQANAACIQTTSMEHKQASIIGNRYVRATISGVIVARNVNLGEYATADTSRSVSGQPLTNNGKSLFVIADSARGTFSANIDQRFYRDVRPGMPIEIGLEAYPGRSFQGQVTQVTPLVQPNMGRPASTSVDLSAPLTFMVRADFDSGNHPAVAGQVGMLTLRHSKRVVVVPQAAVTSYGIGEGLAYAVSGGTAHVRKITYDPSSDGMLHVTHGLKPGEQVVVSDVTELKDGMTVHPVSETAANFNEEAPR